MINQDNTNNEEQMKDKQVRHDPYYEQFDQMTNDGRVFAQNPRDVHQPPPIKELTADEVNARAEYKNIINQLRAGYDDLQHPVAKTQEEVLQQRVVAPCLAFDNDYVSVRSVANECRACRMYPKEIYSWNEFRDQVEGFKSDDSLMSYGLRQIFYVSLINARNEASNEAGEQHSLTQNLNQTLSEAGIVHSIRSEPTLSGRVDFCVMKDSTTASIICECKSTHNLLLPMSANECTSVYNTAYAHGAEEVSRSIEWSNVAHPIGQLLGYMVDNKHRYGALTSGTRTYFVKIQGPEGTTGRSKINPDDVVQSSDVYEGVSPNDSKKMKAIDDADRQDSHKERSNVGTLLVRSVQNLLSGTKHEAKTDQNRKVASRRRKNPRNSNGQSEKLAQRNTSWEADSGVKVYISDAWCVGEANYLRAWAYMHTLFESGVSWTDPTDWIQSTTNKDTPTQWKKKKDWLKRPDGTIDGKPTSPNDVHDSGPDGSGKSAESCNMEYFFPLHQGAFQYAPIDTIEILDVLGHGRNGACYKVKWNGTEYAMKQFDIGRDGDTYFMKEIIAYMLLRKAWGKLVPRPIFLSESFSGGIMFLGLQLGGTPTKDGDLEKFENVLQQIETEYGIRHNDVSRGRNMIILTDDDGVTRVAAIDFEDWDAVSVDTR